MFFKEFEVRWNDLDANRHLANSAYINFMSHTRMSFLTQLGFAHREFETHEIGPVVFYEHIYYFKEVFPGKPIKVSLEITGMSADGRFFEFHHNFYDSKGKHLAHCEMMFAWIDMKTRKLVALPKEAKEIFDQHEKSPDFRMLTKEDTRRHAKVPKDLA
ncbi:acyl-CoA thioesterase [Flagellimonas myxillae]|uniref:acyl-CoA thioesterase n=1 Tax=Flagellimonas myxillae TaxID=2942214 RepID=UPI00201EE68C|nr:acyl-CoA thioesterase [Muricauda myxillae]MCL6267415.1 thioesterase family protein [Muricauda myxillae]